MREKLRALARLMAFLAGLVVLVALLGRLFVPKGNAPEDDMLDVLASGILSEPEDTIDVLFVGDSEGNRAFVPLELWKEHGITSYNCSTPGENLYHTYTWVRKAFRRQRPRLVVVETHVILQPLPFSHAILQAAGEAFPLIDYHSRWKRLKPRDLDPRIEYTYIQRDKGYRYDTSVAGVELEEDYMEGEAGSSRLEGKNRIMIRRIAGLCREHGAQLLLVSVPSTTNWNHKKHRAIEGLAAELGCEYIDMNLLQDEIRIDWTQDTKDSGDHLNHSGALKATGWLGQWLAGQGLLSDHRGDARYAPWDEALQSALDAGMAL